MGAVGPAAEGQLQIRLAALTGAAAMMSTNVSNRAYWKKS